MFFSPKHTAAPQALEEKSNPSRRGGADPRNINPSFRIDD